MTNSNNLIFITGATGLVGSYLARLLLKKGYRVRALKRATSKLDLLGADAERIEWVTGDVLDIPALEDAMEGVDQVFHCAAMVSYDPKFLKEMMAINVDGTANVVNVALFREVKKLVHISSIAALGKSKHGEPVSEQTKWERDKRNTNYSTSKYQSEQEVWRGYAEGLSVAIVNPSVVLGAGRWRQSSTALFKQVYDGLKFYPPGGNGFVDVRDVAQMALQLMESDIEGERFIANGANLKFRDLFNRMAEGLDKPAPTIKVTPLLGGLAWRAMWLKSKLTGKSPLITRETVRSATGTVVYDASKSEKILNFEYRPIVETIRETAAVLRETGVEDTGLLEV